VEDARHYFVRGEEVVCVERVDDAPFGLTEMAGVGDATEHEEAHDVRMDGSTTIEHLACLVVVVKGLTHELDVLCELLARALAKHEVIHQRKGACERATI
jgi:hypothetical protein